MAATAKTSVTPKKKTVKAAPAATAAKTRTSSKPAATATKAKPDAKPAVTAKKSPTKTAATAKPAVAKARIKRVDPGQRRNYIEMAAYYIAERRGFIGGNEADDWAAAEIEIDRLLKEGKLNG